MAKQLYEVTEAYLAMGNRNVYRGSKVELDSNNPGTKILLEMGAIRLVPKVKAKEKENESD